MLMDDDERGGRDSWLAALKVGDTAFIDGSGIGREVRKVTIDKIVGKDRRRKIEAGNLVFDFNGRATGHTHNAPHLRAPTKRMFTALAQQNRDRRLDLLDSVKDMTDQQKSMLDTVLADEGFYDVLKAIRLEKKGY